MISNACLAILGLRCLLSLTSVADHNSFPKDFTFRFCHSPAQTYFNIGNSLKQRLSYFALVRSHQDRSCLIFSQLLLPSSIKLLSTRVLLQPAHNPHYHNYATRFYCSECMGEITSWSTHKRYTSLVFSIICIIRIKGNELGIFCLLLGL